MELHRGCIERNVTVVERKIGSANTGQYQQVLDNVNESVPRLAI